MTGLEFVTELVMFRQIYVYREAMGRISVFVCKSANASFLICECKQIQGGKHALLDMQVFFRKRAANNKALLRKVTCNV